MSDIQQLSKMGRKRVRAQRKFAQGAYIPPQNNPATSAPAVPPQASHRAVSAGPVVVIKCSARDLLTRLSLEKGHVHEMQPVVCTLEYDIKDNKKTSPNKKLNDKSSSKTPQRKQPYSLRNRKQTVFPNQSIRRSSVSDSGEDNMPLSSLATLNATAALKESTEPSIPVKGSLKTTTPQSAVSKKSRKSKTATTTVSKVSIDSSKSLTPYETVSVAIEESPEVLRAITVSCVDVEYSDSSNAVTACSRKKQKKGKIVKQKKKVHYSASRVSPKNQMLMNNDTKILPSSSVAKSKKRPSDINLEELNMELCAVSPEKQLKPSRQLRLRRPNITYQDRNFAYGNVSDVTSLPGSIDSRIRDPDYQVANNKSHEKTRAVDRSYPASVSEFSIISSQTDFCGFYSDDEFPTLRYEDDEPESGDLLPPPPIETIDQTADWVRTHHQMNHAAVGNLENDTSPDLEMNIAKSVNNIAALGETNFIVPGTSQLPTPAGGSNAGTYEGRRRISFNTLKNIVPGGIGNSPRTSTHNIESDNTFKMPDLPARFIKRTKNCPTRMFDNLKDLLNNSLFDKDHCNMCRRCDLLTIYNRVSSQLPSSDANEPDILEMLPRDEYEFDADDEGIKLLRRGRELVRNVLTTKRFPIWLSNPEMALTKNMFQNEHQLGTLKRTLQLDTGEGMDTIVNKIITRVDYLSRCLIEDKMELDQEKSRQRLRSTKPSQPKKVSRRCRKKVKQSKTTPRRKNQPVHTPVNKVNSKDMIRVVESQPIVYLHHLEDDPKLGERHRTAPPAANNSPLDEITVNDTVSVPIGPDYTNQAPANQPASSTCVKISPRNTGMEGAPVFRPTLEQFEDPITYIKSIENQARKYGICKIVPPKEFLVSCHLDDDAMFSSMNQFLGRLYQRWGPNTREMTAIQTYLATIASPRERDQFTKVPLFEGVELDLVKLYHLVLEEGGIAKLLAHSENWARIAEHMSLVSPRGKPDPKKLEKLYCKHVLPYESLSNEERNSILKKVDTIWGERSQSAIRRAKRPLHYQRSALGETTSDDDDEPPIDPGTELERTIGKPCFDRAEECTAKGRTINLATFRRIGAQIQAMRFGKTQPSTLEIEEEYWNILKKGNEHVCVLSAFIDTSVDNLGHTADPEEPGGEHPWNLKRLGENLQNILRPLGKMLSVTVPTLALNQLFSTNCWHMDPHQLAWMDFMHEGATKIWYAVPAHGSNKLRHAVASIIPSAAQNKGIWLASDTTMVPLEKLLDRGVPVFRLEQNPGEFIVVFPGAYASSIATGLTISESIYFEDKSYLFKINKIFQELRQDCEPAMFSSTLLLLRIARDETITYDMLRYVYASLDKLIKEELELRLAAVKRKCWIQLDQSGRASGQETPISWPNQEECSHCRSPLILSKMYRYNNPRSLMCLSHGLRIFAKAPVYEMGEPAAVTLLYSNEELQDELTALADRLLSAA